MIVVAAKELELLDVGVVAIFIECADGFKGVAPVFAWLRFWVGNDGFGLSGQGRKAGAKKCQDGSGGEFVGWIHNVVIKCMFDDFCQWS